MPHPPHLPPLSDTIDNIIIIIITIIINAIIDNKERHIAKSWPEAAID